MDDCSIVGNREGRKEKTLLGTNTEKVRAAREIIRLFVDLNLPSLILDSKRKKGKLKTDEGAWT